MDQLSNPAARVLTMGLISIDPGKCTGWAAWWNGQLWCCGVATVDEWLCVPFGWFQASMASRWEVVCELPQVYRNREAKGDPNDLIKVAVEVGQWKERARTYGASYKQYMPVEWKGQVPKEIHHKRATRALSPEELARVPEMSQTKGHNMWDAIALGLFHLGRLRR